MFEMPRDQFRHFVMLRGGTNYLRIEQGRWVGERREARKCMVCLCDSSVEDEEHFLLNCTVYVREREKLFEEIRMKCNVKIDEKNTSKEEMMKIMIGNAIEDEKIAKEVRKRVIRYIMKIKKIRDKYVNNK